MNVVDSWSVPKRPGEMRSYSRRATTSASMSFSQPVSSYASPNSGTWTRRRCSGPLMSCQVASQLPLPRDVSFGPLNPKAWQSPSYRICGSPGWTRSFLNLSSLMVSSGSSVGTGVGSGFGVGDGDGPGEPEAPGLALGVGGGGGGRLMLFRS